MPTLFENHTKYSILAFFNNSRPFKNFLSGNTVWKVASLFEILVKLMEFGNLSKKKTLDATPSNHADVIPPLLCSTFLPELISSKVWLLPR